MRKPPADKRYTGIRFLFRALLFRIKAGNAHAIHSPFLFDFYNQLVRGKPSGDSFTAASQYRKELLSDGSLIRYNASGTSSGKIKELSVSEIARTQSVGCRKARLLYKITDYFRPSHIIELGTNLGIGTYFLSAGSHGKVFTIEGSKELFDFAQMKLTHKPDIDVELIYGEFHERLPMVLEQLTEVDFVFIDGDHSQQSTLEYFELCRPKANDNTVFVFDDIHWSPGMEYAWRKIVDDPDVSLAVDLYFCGIVFFRKDLSKQFFCLRY